jgi:hypothetical protein
MALAFTFKLPIPVNLPMYIQSCQAGLFSGGKSYLTVAEEDFFSTVRIKHVYTYWLASVIVNGTFLEVQYRTHGTYTPVKNSCEWLALVMRVRKGLSDLWVQGLECLRGLQVCVLQTQRLQYSMICGHSSFDCLSPISQQEWNCTSMCNWKHIAHAHCTY